MTAEIICVGTEILLGNIVNTNAAYLSERLASLGISVFFETTVGDNPERLENVIRQGLERSDILILSGGLGPTKDDLTKEIATKACGQELAAITIPLSEAIRRNPLMINSLAIIMIATIDDKRCIPTNAIIAEQTNNLSANGSINFPKLVTRLYFLAILPSKRSVKLARINIPTAIYLPHPMLRYRHIRNKGIIITLAIVSLLGKFI